MDFHVLFARNPIPMWVHDSKTLAFLDVNQSFLDGTGYKRSEFLQMKLGDIFSLDEIPALLTNLKGDHKTKADATLQQLRHKDGYWVGARLSATDLEYNRSDAQLVTVIFRGGQTLETLTLEARLRISEFAHSHSLDDILQKTLDEAEALTGSNIGFFHFMEADQKTLLLQTWSTNTLKNMCTAEGKLLHYPLAQAGVWADCVRKRKPVVYNDYQGLKRVGTLPAGHSVLSRILTVPILRGENIVAIFGVGNKPTEYDDHDVWAVNLLADLAWDIAGAKYVESALRTTEYSYRAVMDQASDGIFVADSNGNYIDVNHAGCELLGYTREEILSLSVRDLMVADPSEPPRFEELRQGKSLLTERHMRRKNGELVFVEIGGRMLADGRLLGIVRDITERKKEEEKLKYLALVVSRISSAVISTDPELCITQWNKAAEMLYGWREVEVLGRSLDEVCRTEFQNNSQKEARQTLETEKRWGGELRQFHRDGREIWVDSSIALLEDERGNITGSVTINHDITERKRTEEQLRRAQESMQDINRTLQHAFEREQIASRTDSLTGMFNRRYFFELLEYEFAASRRYQRSLSIVMFDVDWLKRINDTHGHQVGDEVLKYVARIVHSHLRESDILARYGGDEFTILLPNSNARETATVLRRIHHKLKSMGHFVAEKGNFPVTISAGIASWQPGMERTADLIRLADEALYAAKEAGRDRMVVAGADAENSI